MDSENQKSKWSLEPDIQGTRQECGRLKDLTLDSGQAIPPKNLDPLKKEEKDCFQEQSHQKSHKQESYFDRQEVEEQTRNNKSDRWHKERKYKLTSSRFGEICKRRKYDLKYCESLITNQKDLSHIPAVRFGLNQ